MELVEGSQKVEQVFGHWPSFHDAEVLEITLDRRGHGAARSPTVRFTVCAFRMTDEVDSRGLYVLRDHVLVRFTLYSAEVRQLEGFNSQNALSGLHFSRSPAPSDPDRVIQVDLEPSHGVAASFQCARAEVVSVEPVEPRELPS